MTVSIILLNWNSRPTVFDAAASALAQRGVEVELVIVDNGSEDGSLEELRARFPTARYVALGRNTGFTGGMNAGTSAATGDFVLWQNADLVLAPDYCARAVEIMTQESDVGAVGGLVRRLVGDKRTNQFDAAGYTLTPNHRPRFLSHDVSTDVVGVSGSCPFLRRPALDSLKAITGYVLDPWYFTYGEDIDVMLRLNLAGWRVRYCPDLLAWHVRSASTVPASRFYQKPPITQIHHFKNRLATIVKTTPTSDIARRLPALLATEIGLLFYLLLKRPSSVGNWIRGWREVWKERRRLLHDREAIQSHAPARSIQRLQQLLSPNDDRSNSSRTVARPGEELDSYEIATRHHYQNQTVAQDYHEQFTSRWSLGRFTHMVIARAEQRAIAQLLKRLPQPPASAADIPCGTGKLVPILGGIATVGGDMSRAMMSFARASARARSASWRFVQLDTTALPFRADSFDVVICLRLLHRVPDHVKQNALTELARVSRGQLIVSYGITNPWQRFRHRLRRLISPQSTVPHPITRRDVSRLFAAIGCRAVLRRSVLPILSAEEIALLVPRNVTP